MAPTEDHEIDDRSFLRAILLGIVVGMSAMFVVSTAIVVLGGQSVGMAAGIAVWVGVVIGPYAGGLAMLSASGGREAADVRELRRPVREEVARRAS